MCRARCWGLTMPGGEGHDGWAPYDRFTRAKHPQCLNHLLTRARQLIEQNRRGARRFPQAMQDLLGAALDLRDRSRGTTDPRPTAGARTDRISARGLALARGRLERRLDRLLAMRLRNRPNRRFQAHLNRHRDQILTFLYEPNLEATHWPAEQAIRPAVVHRKLCGGNRSPTGAHALEVLASVFATCRQNALDSLTVLSHLLRQPTRSCAQLV